MRAILNLARLSVDGCLNGVSVNGDRNSAWRQYIIRRSQTAGQLPLGCDNGQNHKHK
jgi:hypothetical protein